MIKIGDLIKVKPLPFGSLTPQYTYGIVISHYPNVGSAYYKKKGPTTIKAMFPELGTIKSLLVEHVELIDKN